MVKIIKNQICLISRISAYIKIIIAGISSTKRIEEIEAISKNREISFMHQAGWVNSRKGYLDKIILKKLKR